MKLKRNLIPFILLTLVVLPLTLFPAHAQDTAQPKSVTIAGTVQSKLGCAGDWDPSCDKTFLQYDESNGVWSATFDLEAGDYEYKVALNGTWDVNYGANAAAGGANITLKLAKAGKVQFVFSNETHLVMDSVNNIIATLAGSYQKELGCPDDWQPACLRTVLQGPNEDGKYTFTSSKIPVGDWEVKVAYNGAWAENYGAGGARDGANVTFSVTQEGNDVYFEFDPKTKILAVNVAGAPKGNIKKQMAQWVSKDTLAWKPKVADVFGAVYALHYDPNGQMTLDADGLKGGESIPLKVSFGGLSSAIVVRNPQLNGYTAMKIASADLDKVPTILKGQIVITASDKDGKLLDASGVQIPGALDDLFAYSGELGVSFADGVPTLRVWAPTSTAVALQIFDTSVATEPSLTTDMAYDTTTGVWSVTGQPDWKGKFYRYAVTVYAPATGKVEKNLVTDPYSVSLSPNSLLSQIVDLNDSTTAPAGWADVKKSGMAAPEDIVLYELHVRDFSIYDQTVPENLRGTFAAFTVKDSNGMKHLAALAKAGLTHIHLQPIFDFATINEDKSKRTEATVDELKALPADSDKQQELVNANRKNDGFNWGYDPFHYNVPEGSYSTNPDGSQRIVELRSAVMSLNDVGLRVVMDVVYNHTNASGENDKSVLDKIVPGYYHRLNEEGKIEQSTCCENTATEHKMMGKLMVDSVVLWAKQYKVDGFRFDLMGHHMVDNMLAVRAALDALTLEKDGVDGKAIYIYGEGWDFGEVAKNARGKNATQINLAGTGIGTFNDRLRDSARGGSPFGDQTRQGFINGLFDFPNATTDQGTPEEQKARAFLFADRIRVGLAGNLKTYSFVNASGATVTGDRIDYNGQPTGYTLDPQENIAYVSAHDNETLFDIIQYKAPTALKMPLRVRMQNLGNSLTMFSQGVPFFLAGDEALRSKSMDKDSYDSGDWFNALDWTFESNGWGHGLPIADKNKDLWPLQQPLLANADLKPSKADILQSIANFEELLQIRRSSGLFRLRTGDEVQKAVKFYNVGPNQVPDLIVMSITAPEGVDIEGDYKQIVVIFNATTRVQTGGDPELSDPFVLHPVQVNSSDPIVKASNFSGGKFTVPAYTTAVFVVKK